MARPSREQLQLELKERADGLEVTSQLVRIAIEALSLRMLTAFALVADCVMFGWALANGGWQALATAVLCAFALWCVMNLKLPTGKEKGDET